jgi:hypothetical protein
MFDSRFSACRELLAVGHDGHDLRALRGDPGLRLGARLGVDAAIRAPMSAMKGDGDRPYPQQAREADEIALLVRQNERRHRIADLWDGIAEVARHEPHDQPVDGLLHRRTQHPRRRREGLETVAQGGVHVAAIEECLFERMKHGSRHRQSVLPRQCCPWSGEQAQDHAFS